MTQQQRLSSFLLIFMETGFFQVLVKMLDVDVLSNEEERLQIISTLQSSLEGQKAYEALCEK